MTHPVTQKVSDLVAQHGTRDPFALCRALDIVVTYAPLGRQVKAMYYRMFDADIILLDESLNETEQVIVLAHELGHCLLHPGMDACFILRSTLYPLSRYEHEADSFARALLWEDVLDLSSADPAVRAILLP